MSAPSRRPPARRPPPRRPRRRLPARVYWVRRLLVLGVVVALVWVGTALLGGNGDETRETSSSQDSTAEATTTTPPTTTPTLPRDDDPKGHQGQPGTGSTRPQVVTAALPVADGECLTTDVTVAPALAGRPRSGEDVAVALSVATTAPSACRMELSSDVLLLKVSTGGEPVWDTEQCPGAVPEQTVVLRPGWTTSVIVTWPGVYGDKTCTGTTRDAPPGAYAVEAAVYEGEPGRADFELEPPADPSGHGGHGGEDADEGHGQADEDGAPDDGQQGDGQT